MTAVFLAALAFKGGLGAIEAYRDAHRVRDPALNSLKTLGTWPVTAEDYRARAEYHAACVENLGRMLKEAEHDEKRAVELAREGWNLPYLRAMLRWRESAVRRNRFRAANPWLPEEPDPPMPDRKECLAESMTP